MDEKVNGFLKGRGAQSNPHNRFDKYSYEDWDGMTEPTSLNGKTKFISVHPKTIVNKVTSPDVGMEYSLNPYQGCEHGCTYCYARPTHEYWGYSPGVDFEKVILVKENAPDLLRKTLDKKSWKVGTIVLSGNTDCYQPCERNFGITRELLKVCLEYRNPVGIITKNTLVERDLDVLSELSELGLATVNISLTTLNESLRRKLEPRTASSTKKLKLIEKLRKSNIPVNVLMAPVIPSLNDHEILSIAKSVSSHGANSMGVIIARLNGPNASIFEKWLELHYPDRKDKVIHQLEQIHGGSVGSSEFGKRMRGEGTYALNIHRQFEIAVKKYFSPNNRAKLRKDLFRVPPKNGQLELF